MVKYSIIIPTCHKEMIERCLKYIAELKQPKFEYEVIVIQNSSDENIKEIVDGYVSRIQNLRFCYESNLGIIHSRHRGIVESNGEILCYLDDDSFVDKDWLVEIEKTFNENVDAVLVGGNNLPLFETSPPKWLKYFWKETSYGKYLSELSLIDFYKNKMKIPAWFVFGCNFIIKKSVLLEYKGFNPDTYNQDMIKYRGDGETALSCKLNKSGHVAYFNPKIKIHHFVPKSRMTLEYFKKRGFCQGISDSFSNIRLENGFSYFSFEPNSNLLKKRLPIIQRKFKKHIRPLIIKLDKIFNWQDYKTYMKIKSEYKESYMRGYEFHQNEVKNDSELKHWVLKENYL